MNQNRKEYTNRQVERMTERVFRRSAHFPKSGLVANFNYTKTSKWIEIEFDGRNACTLLVLVNQDGVFNSPSLIMANRVLEGGAETIERYMAAIELAQSLAGNMNGHQLVLSVHRDFLNDEINEDNVMTEGREYETAL